MSRHHGLEMSPFARATRNWSESFDLKSDDRFTPDAVMAMYHSWELQERIERDPFAVVPGIIECDMKPAAKLEMLRAAFAKAIKDSTCAVDSLAVCCAFEGRDPQICVAVVEHVLAAGRRDILADCDRLMEETVDLVTCSTTLKGDKPEGFAPAMPGMLDTIVWLVEARK
eukprot:jgi/Tetstr1/464222/TSEL_009027.t1